MFNMLTEACGVWDNALFALLFVFVFVVCLSIAQSEFAGASTPGKNVALS